MVWLKQCVDNDTELKGRPGVPSVKATWKKTPLATKVADPDPREALA